MHAVRGDGVALCLLEQFVVLVLLAKVLARHVHRENGSMRIMHYGKKIFGATTEVCGEIIERMNRIAFVRFVLVICVFDVQRENCPDNTHQYMCSIHAQGRVRACARTQGLHRAEGAVP